MEKQSAALNNLIKALRYVRSLGSYPRAQGGGVSFFAILGNIQTIDQGRQRYYGHDEESLKIFDWVSQARIVFAAYGREEAKDVWNGPFTTEEWAALEHEALKMTGGFVNSDYILDRVDTWILEAYSLKGRCETLPGDVVLDCGTFTGNTSAYFAQRVGPGGHVYGFEPVEEIFQQYRQNMFGLGNVTPVRAAITDKKGFVDIGVAGYGSSMDLVGNSLYPQDRVPAWSIDEFVEENGLERVDFIKMDIEGAEGQALYGAKHTIERFTPRMALSAYHKDADILNLPESVLRINSRYKFALRHFSNDVCETVLYCYID